MNCSKCKRTLQPDDKFCSECGARVVQQAEARIVFCPNTIYNERRTKEPCGKEIKEEMKFCNECGWKINQSCFQPDAKMCSGEQINGVPCSNIVTIETKFCSQCGCPPIFQDGKYEMDGKDKPVYLKIYWKNHIDLHFGDIFIRFTCTIWPIFSKFYLICRRQKKIVNFRSQKREL